MKNLIAILGIITVFSINTFATETEKNTNVNQLTEASNNAEINLFPYAKTDFVPMNSIFSQNEYTVYRVESDFVESIPSCQPVGENYHYFIYKNGQFLMTVNECNKQKVFEYLSK